MKKLLVILTILAANFYTANAQLFKVFGHDVGFIYVGPKVGMNFSKFSQWSYTGYEVKNRIGYQLGVVGDFGFTNRFSFQTELNFISKGTKGIYGTVEETKRMPAIQIPLLAKYTFSLLGLKRVYVNGGVYSTTRIGSGKVIYEDGAVYDDYHWTRFDWGFSAGCGAEYPTKDGIWGLDLRYDLGMVDIYRQMDENTKSRFRSFQFALTYKFDMVDLYFKLRKKNNDEGGDRETGNKGPKGLKVEQRN
jgi:hypothetical protein